MMVEPVADLQESPHVIQKTVAEQPRPELKGERGRGTHDRWSAPENIVSSGDPAESR